MKTTRPLQLACVSLLLILVAFELLSAECGAAGPAGVGAASGGDDRFHRDPQVAGIDTCHQRGHQQAPDQRATICGLEAN